MNKPALESARLVFAQDQDSDSSDPDPHLLTVEWLDAGGGPYLVLKTERWAIDHPNELEKLLRTFHQILLSLTDTR